MTTKRTNKVTSEVQEAAHEDVSTSEVDAVKITLDAYLETASVHPGLLASFKWEDAQRGDQLAARTATEWAAALDAQSKKTYN